MGGSDGSVPIAKKVFALRVRSWWRSGQRCAFAVTCPEVKFV